MDKMLRQSLMIINETPLVESVEGEITEESHSESSSANSVDSELQKLNDFSTMLKIRDRSVLVLEGLSEHSRSDSGL